ncbi:quinolinate synthase [Methanolobus halotolerans]|uniref:Quinolinate synthase n=2 Tax=Methanolobus halotolerans TaxID=2052935 RepID=A0A4E0QU56_9EURY|nr:quinolinate synthase [Methanolobus halotolerans]
MRKEINSLKEQKNAIILAHNYQVAEVQDIADFTGDSLELARKAATLDNDVIVFCGVDFMAETAAILSPDKAVLLPAAEANCPMADMISAGELRVLKERFPDAAVVCYVNTTAEVKAESDICCTSSNAVKVVESLDEDRIIFVPDKNLGSYVSRFSDKEILPWEGFCFVHDRITPQDVKEARNLHPEAEVLVHPECRAEVIDLADGVYSTSGMIRHVCSSPGKEFIIGTEIGILHRMKKECPQKTCYPLSSQAICTNMKKTDLNKVYNSLKDLTPQVVVPEEIADRARKAIIRMLEVR